MRLSELLGREVVGADGATLGTVEDVRLVQDGPMLGAFGHALRVDGLLVGGPALAIRLGYHRTGVRGPWPLRAWFLHRERRARYVDWDQVDTWDGDRIRLRVAASAVASVVDAL